jgi:thioredoxin 1
MTNGHVMEFTSANWDNEVLKSPVPVIVDFWAPGCLPCTRLAPIIDRLADQYAGRVKFGKLNIASEQDVAIRYNVMSIPRVFFFMNGESRQQLLGLRSETEIAQAINRFLA